VAVAASGCIRRAEWLGSGAPDRLTALQLTACCSLQLLLLLQQKVKYVSPSPPYPQLDHNLERLVNQRFRHYMWKKGHTVSGWGMGRGSRNDGREWQGGGWWRLRLAAYPPLPPHP